MEKIFIYLLNLKQYLRNGAIWFFQGFSNFLAALWIHVKIHLLLDWQNISRFYNDLWISLRGKIVLVNSSFSGFILFFIWFTIYLLLITHGIYLPYLAAKFCFFSAKYIWNFFFSLFEFILNYFFGGTIIMSLYNYSFKKLQVIVNFFIFNGIPNLVSLRVWSYRMHRCDNFIRLFIIASIKRLISAISYIRYKLPWLIKYIYMLGLTWWLRFLDFLNYVKLLILKCKRFFRRRYRSLLWKYNMLCYIYSERGHYVWKKKYRLRMNFLKENVKNKSLKYWKKFPINFWNYKFAKIKFFIQKFLHPRYVLIKSILMKLYNFKFYNNKIYIFSQKLVRFICFIFLKFVSFIIYVQCIYFAIFNKFEEFKKNGDYIQDLQGTQMVIEKVQDWIEKKNKVKKELEELEELNAGDIKKELQVSDKFKVKEKKI